MSITGEQLLAAVQHLTELDARAEAASLAMELGDEARERMAAIGIPERSPELFQLFRVSDLRSTQRLKDREKQESFPAFDVFAKRLSAWGVSDLALAKALFEEFFPTYERLRSQLFKSRSMATHVTAVLRPFRLKYVELWKESNVNGINFDFLEKRTHELSSQVVSSRDELTIWQKRVYALFSETAVVRKTAQARMADSKPEAEHKRPLGTISEPSEKIYEHQWRNWFLANSDRLLKTDLSEIPPLRQDAVYRSAPLRRHAEGRDAGAVWRYVNQDNAYSKAARPDSETQVNITIASATNVDLKSEWAGTLQPTARSQVREWLDDTNMFWGSDSVAVTGSVSFGIGETKSTHELPAMSLEKFTDLVCSSIDRKTRPPK
jgi:hypothetical protein